MPIVSVVACDTYELDAVRQAVTAVLAPLGGIDRFVRPGMQVLLKPNLLRASDLERAITTHPAVVQAVTELVQEAGGSVIIGDSPGGPIKKKPPSLAAGGDGAGGGTDRCYPGSLRRRGVEATERQRLLYRPPGL